MVSSEGFINLMAEDIRSKTDSMNKLLENTIINGDASTNTLEFTGLLASITSHAPSSAGAALTIDNVRTDLTTAFEANGMIDLCVMDGSTFNSFKGLLMDFQRNVERPGPTMDFGIPDAFTFDGVLFIKDRYMPTTAGSRQVMYLDTRYVFLAVLQDYTYEELSKNNDSDSYMIKWYGALVVTFESAMVKRTSVA